MTAQAEGRVPVGASSLEVRWMFPGQLDAAVAEWFARFPAQVESREDTYLLDPHLPGLSVKVRGAGAALEVKAYHGSPGILEVAGGARGRMETWHKWSFPCDPPPSVELGASAGWRRVHKTRRISAFSPARMSSQACVPGMDEGPWCKVELTEIRAGAEMWWSLGFEATGPGGSLRSELEAAAALVFAQALPGGVEPGTDDSKSYEQWLRQRWAAEREAGVRRLSL